jgi:hypothetical protein
MTYTNRVNIQEVVRIILHSDRYVHFKQIFEACVDTGIPTDTFVDRIDPYTRWFARDFNLSFRQMRELITQLELERIRLIDQIIHKDWYIVPLRYRGSRI